MPENFSHIGFSCHDACATVTFVGKLDAAVTMQVQGEVERALASAVGVRELTWDGSGMSYISSSGLRLILTLKKRFPTFKVVGVIPEVYSVFEMTGFTKMMTVERGFRQMSIEGCEEIGRGGVGVVYRVSDDTIIKVFREGTSIGHVTKEISMAKEAFVLGMPTAISFDTVQVGSQYGLVYELLRAHTLSQCLNSHPERIDEYARKYAQVFRQMHAIEVPPSSNIPDAHANSERQINHIRRYFDDESVEMLLQILRAIPKANRLLHCDLQTKNTMMQGDELMLIDMGEVGYGHPMLDFANAYSAMVGFVGNYEEVIGIPRELGIQVWEKAIRHYFEGESEATIARRCEQIRTASYIRNFNWLALSDSFPQAAVDECRAVFKERVAKRFDEILEITKTFSDWTL